MITLTQLYDLGISYGIDIFEGISLPEGSPMDLNTLRSTIVMNCGLNIPVYADPKVMQSAVTLWSAKNQYTFEHVGKIYAAEYSPIENTDKYETVTTDHSRDLTDNTVGGSNKTESLSSSNNTSVTENKTSKHSGTDTTVDEQTTSAYNSSSYQPEDKSTTNYTHGENITDTGSGSTKATGSSTKNIKGDVTSDKTVEELEKTTMTTHAHGNIGVMDNATMQTKEAEFLTSFNPYNFISGLFENELTLFIY